MLNMLEYARIINVFDAARSIKSLCKLLSNYQDRFIWDTDKNLRVFWKKNIAWVQVRNQELFRAGEVL